MHLRHFRQFLPTLNNNQENSVRPPGFEFQCDPDFLYQLNSNDHHLDDFLKFNDYYHL